MRDVGYHDAPDIKNEPFYKSLNCPEDVVYLVDTKLYKLDLPRKKDGTLDRRYKGNRWLEYVKDQTK